jgi:2-hydroxy-6-oxonona-2,4-dienedioate hydrolase
MSVDNRYVQAERAVWQHYGLEPREQFIELESPRVRLRVQEVGTGDPVLFVHGTAGNGPYWAPLIRELDGFRCLLLERPGWGSSSAIDFSVTPYPTLTAEVLRGALDALGVGRAHVVGASIGDVWALRLAQTYPARVGRIALLGGGPLVADVPVPRIIRLIASPIGAIMVRLPDKPARVRSILREVGHGATLDAGGIPDTYITWRATLSNTTQSMRNERAMVRAIVGRRGFRSGLTFTEEELAAIGQPTLMIYGANDPTAPLAVWERVTDLLPAGQLHVLANSGHLPWLDDPQAVASQLHNHLREPRSATAPR